jgi:protein TonB
MDYAQQQRNPGKHLVGIAVVILLHIALVYALVNGLARKVVEVIKKPLETQIIEEIKPPPPPPPEVQLPPPPKMLAPPPPYIPPPEVQVNVPPPPNAIQVTSQTPPPEAPPIAVRAPVEAPPAPAAPAPQSAKSACPNYAKALGDSAYPRDAVREGLEKGEAVVRFTVDATGKLKDIHAVRSSHRSFARAAVATVETFQCIGQGRDIIFEVPFSYSRE